MFQSKANLWLVLVAMMLGACGGTVGGRDPDGGSDAGAPDGGSDSGQPDATTDGGGGDGGVDADVDGGNEVLTTLSGAVYEGDGATAGTPIAGATVAAFGTPYSTTTNASGEFSFDVPVGDNFIVASAPTYWGHVQIVHIPAEGRSGFEHFLTSSETVSNVAQAFSPPRNVSESNGVVVVQFRFGNDEQNALGGESASLGATPSDPPFLLTDEGVVEQNMLIAGVNSPIVFTNVTPSAVPFVLASVMGGDDDDCVLEAPGVAHPVLARTVTIIQAECTPKPVTVSGTVFQGDGEASGSPLPGVTVYVPGTALSTVSDAMGEFSLDVPPGQVFLGTSIATHWGQIHSFQVPSDGLTGVSLAATDPGTISEVSVALSRKISDSNAIVVVEFDFVGAEGPLGGESASLGPVGSDPAFVFSEKGLLEQDTLLADEGNVVVFTNVNPIVNPIGTVTVGGGDNDTCVLNVPNVPYPVAAKSFTNIAATCTLLPP